jgi:hypothetical protein
MKYIITENRLYSVAMKWLNNEFGDLKLYDYNKFRILFMKDGEIIFDYDKKNGVVHISYEHIGKYLESLFGMENRQIQEVIKLWVEQYYNLPVRAVTSNNDFHENIVWRDIIKQINKI